MDVLLLHDVQLWERPQSLAGKAEPAELLSEVFSENINHSVVVAAAGQCYIKGPRGPCGPNSDFFLCLPVGRNLTRQMDESPSDKGPMENIW